MESSDHLSPPHVDASRPSLGFPLGTALLLIIIFSLSGILSCCYHWDKLRSLRQSFSDSDPQNHSSPHKSKLHTTVRIITNFLITIYFSHLTFVNYFRNFFVMKIWTRRQKFVNSNDVLFLFVSVIQELKKNMGQSFSVMMPGDEVPKFIAMPCPCQPSRPENIVVTVEKPPQPPKPPQQPIPLYL